MAQAIKEILIKVVAQAIPIFTMSCFLLPKYFCDDLNRMMASFWWNSSNDDKTIHWLSWDKLCLPKADGGLGFRNLYDFNLALLAKQGWRLLQQPDSVTAQVIKAKYYPNHSFLEAVVSPHSSCVWKSICDARKLLICGSRWQLGSGEEINIWNDRWVPQPSTFQVFFI